MLMVLHNHDCGKVVIDIITMKKHHNGSHNPKYCLIPIVQRDPIILLLSLISALSNLKVLYVIDISQEEYDVLVIYNSR